MPIKLLVALDFDNAPDALNLVDQLDPDECGVKVGSELFTLLGPAFIRTLVAKKFRVFLDLKFHDIPNTVSRACHIAADLGVWMINVHAAGGYAMMHSAQLIIESYGNARPLLVAVTALTSLSPIDLTKIAVQQSMEEYVVTLAQLAHQAGLDGVVCSALEVPMIKNACGRDFLTVTPGIRLPDNKHDDQTRIITPHAALQAGSDFLVIGRPITRAFHPSNVVKSVLDIIRAN